MCKQQHSTFRVPQNAYSALMKASEKGQKDIVRELLATPGIDVNHTHKVMLHMMLLLCI
jgi:hypothetical protein